MRTGIIRAFAVSRNYGMQKVLFEVLEYVGYAKA